MSQPERHARKTARRTLGVWFNEKSGHIHLASPGLGKFISTVSNDPKSKRYHPDIYRKLARVLCDAGLPAPAATP